MDGLTASEMCLVRALPRLGHDGVDIRVWPPLVRYLADMQRGLLVDETIAREQAILAATPFGQRR